MPDLDQPVTRRELRAELQELRNELCAEFATKTELYTMKADLQAATEGLRGHGARLTALETRVTKVEADRN